MNLGVDFGSSFSCFSRWNFLEDRLEALQIGAAGSAFVPTLVTISEAGEWECGQIAQKHVADPTYKRFRACKMLLNADASEWKKHDSYSDEYSPERIAEYFLKNRLEEALYACQEEQIEQMVLCVPELWAKGIRTPDPKTALYRICQKVPQLKNGKVKIVTEPEAASAYTAYCCRKASGGKNFEGYLLIVDYGGGTLDITLTEVDTTMQDGKEITRISTRGRGGQGENHNGRIGIGGISYMTRVSEMLLCSVRPDLRDENDPARVVGTRRQKVLESPEFVSLYQEVEAAVTDSTGIKAVDKALKKNRFDPNGAMPEDMTVVKTICWNNETGDKCSADLTIAMLYRAYVDNVEQVLKKELDKMLPVLEKYVADPYDPSREDFKIVLVGGFGKYKLVENQLYRYFHVTDSKADKRLNSSLSTAKETAISYGAALIANDFISVRRTAPLSLGIFGSNASGRTFFNAITFGQIMEENTVYYVRREPEKNRPEEGIIQSIYSSERSPEFAINFSGELNRAYGRYMNPEYWSNQIVLPANSKCALGFRIDDSNVISFIISEYKNSNQAGKILREIRLDCYEKIFGRDGVLFFDDEPFTLPGGQSKR